MFEDLRNTLVSIASEEALCRLIGLFLEFCNISLSNWYVLLLFFGLLNQFSYFYSEI